MFQCKEGHLVCHQCQPLIQVRYDGREDPQHLYILELSHLQGNYDGKKPRVRRLSHCFERLIFEVIIDRHNKNTSKYFKSLND